MGKDYNLKDVPNGEYFKIYFMNLDRKTLEFLKSIMINQGDIIQVVRRVPELGNDSMVVKTKDGQLVTLYSEYVKHCYGFVLEQSEIIDEGKKKIKKLK